MKRVQKHYYVSLLQALQHLPKEFHKKLYENDNEC